MASAPRKGNDDATVSDIGERLGPCPGCGKEVVLGLGRVALGRDVWEQIQAKAKQSQGAVSKRVLVHALPSCQYFIDTDSHVIVKAIARAARRAGQDAPS